MGKQSKKAETNNKDSITIDMITPLQMEIIRAVNDIGTYKEFTAKTILDVISPQEEPLTTEDIDLLLRRMMQTTVECDLNPIYTHPKSKNSRRHKQTIFGNLLNLQNSQLPVLGMDEATYVLNAPPIVLRYQNAIDSEDIEEVTTDMQGFVAICEDEVLGKNQTCKNWRHERMNENLTVTLSMSDWELAGFNTLCEERGYSPSDALRGFAKWCAEEPAQAKKWLTEEMI